MHASLLISVQSIAADTVVALQSRDLIARSTDIAILVAAVALSMLAVLAFRTLRHFNGTMKEIRLTMRQNLGPVSDRARSISDDIQFITQSLRTDTERLNGSVQALAARLHQVSDRMEERIEEFNALMEMVQSEAEDIFLDTAATVRGVREGARTLSRGRKGPPEPWGDPSLEEPTDDDLSEEDTRATLTSDVPAISEGDL